jgi:hypothetical protein
VFLTSGSSAEVQTEYQVQRSLRFRASASAYLSRTPTVGGSRTMFTFSAWVKLGSTTTGALLSSDFASTGGLNEVYFSNGSVAFYYEGSGTKGLWYTTGLFRDPTAWYHVVVVADSTQAVTSNMVAIYVNGVKQTITFSNLSSGTPAQNTNWWITSTTTHRIGNSATQGIQFDGYLAEVNFIDGQTLTPTSFGEYSTYSHWKPKQYVGTYGTTGFYLPFSNTTSTTTLCADASGNGNNWTPANISLTVGATYDSMYDVPLGGGGSVGNGLGNYPVINPITNTNGYMTVSGGNLSASVGGQDKAVAATQSVPTTGKWYWEYRITTAGLAATVGLVDGSLNSSAGTGFTWSFVRTYSISGAKSPGGAYGASYTSGDLIAVAVDVDAGTLTFYKNNVSQGIAFSDITSSGVTWYPLIYCNSGSVSINFGQQPFAYTPPAGFKALHTGNLPTPVITNPKLYHNTYTYLGNGAELQIGETQKAQDLVTIDRSLRFTIAGAKWLRRTVSGANARTFTISTWVKGVGVASGGPNSPLIIGGTDAQSEASYAQLTGIVMVISASLNVISTTAVFNNPAKWYHSVWVVDTTQATPTNRVKMYVDGVPATLAPTQGGWPAQNANIYVNGGMGINNRPVGTAATAGFYGEGYLADYNYIDGQALTPTSFGQFDGNNYWVPKTYSGTYGTAGFHLDFSDSTNTTTIAADSSGNGNNWIAQNISLTTGSTYDSMVDTPTNNYATLNPLNGVSLNGTGATLSNSNLTATAGPTASTGTFFTGTLLPLAGKFYVEITIAAVGTANINFGLLAEVASSTYSNVNTILATLYSSVSQCSIAVSGTTVQSNLGFAAANEVYGVAYDAGAGTVQFYRNGSVFGTQISGIATVNRTFALYVSRDSIGSASAAHLNFGQRPFTYTPPTGFVALSENNISEVIGDLESPDLVWIKSRSAVQSHTLFDSVRGVGNILSTDTTAPESIDVNSLRQFNKNGFYLGNSATVNTLNNSYVAWAWKAGTTTVTNTTGSITSQVRANPTSGFSVVTYTGNGIDGSTVGHGLGISPNLVIVRTRNNSGNFRVMHTSLAASTNVYLNATNAADVITVTGGGGIATTPSSTTFTLTTGASSNANNVNASAWTYVAYCFAEIVGYSKFGSYTGNGSADGPFVYCGFKPAFLMIKRTDSATANWNMFDSIRNPSNVVNRAFFPNASSAEVEDTNRMLDFTSTGFKIRQGAPATTEFNGSGGSFIFIAFAEAPLKYSLAR